MEITQRPSQGTVLLRDWNQSQEETVETENCRRKFVHEAKEKFVRGVRNEEPSREERQHLQQ